LTKSYHLWFVILNEVKDLISLTIKILHFVQDDSGVAYFRRGYRFMQPSDDNGANIVFVEGINTRTNIKVIILEQMGRLREEQEYN